MPNDSALLRLNSASFNESLQSAFLAYHANTLLRRFVIDGQIKTLSHEKKQAKAQMQALLNKGYQLARNEEGLFYFTKELRGGSPVDELKRKLATKPAEQRCVFISYRWEEKEIAKKLQEVLEARGFMVIRDDDHLKDGSNLEEFMQIINNHNVNYVLPIISSGYLESANCMYEVGQILRRDNWKTNLLPYVIISGPTDAKIYGGISAHITYWKIKREHENNAQEQNKLDNILRSIEPFLYFLSGRVNSPEAEIMKNNYAGLFQMIENIEKEFHTIIFEEIDELLRTAILIAKKDNHDKAKEKFVLAKVKVDALEHVFGVEEITGRVYGLYGEYLVEQKTEKEQGGKYLATARKCGFKDSYSSNNASASSSNNNNNITASSSSSDNPAEVAQYLRHVSNGEQDKVEAMLKTNPSLKSAAAVIYNHYLASPKICSSNKVRQLLSLVAQGDQTAAEELITSESGLLLESNDVTDLSGRKFEGITAFQYAVWALDWHMWKMMRKYLAEDEARVQINRFETGSWVAAHGRTAEKFIQNLVDSLKQLIDNSSNWSWEQFKSYWVKEVGGNQKLLPAHVINEYCRPDLSFNDNRNFQDEQFPRTRETNEGEWFTANYSGGLLGNEWASFRGAASWRGSRRSVACGGLCLYYGGRKQHIIADKKAIERLLTVRKEQCAELMASLKNTNTTTLHK